MTVTKLAAGTILLAAAVTGIVTPPDPTSWTVWPLVLLAVGGGIAGSGLLDWLDGDR